MNRTIQKICAIVFLSLAVLFVQSCSDDAKSVTEQELTQAEVKTILITDDISGIADNALAELFAGDGTTTKTAKANDCYVAEYTETGFVATFNNCVLNGTDNVNGTVTATYEMAGETASFAVTFTDFYVGDIKLNGTRDFVVNGDMEGNSFSFTVTSNMTIELADGSIIEETGNKTFTFTFGESLDNITIGLSGTWTIKSDGNTYSIESDGVQADAQCGNFTTGTMTISKNGLVVTVDFGDGGCDDKATLIYPDGTTEEITI
jgi:hypothetical protein